MLCWKHSSLFPRLYLLLVLLWACYSVFPLPPPSLRKQDPFPSPLIPSGPVHCRIASSCSKVTLGIWQLPWEITTGSFVSGNNLLWPHTCSNQEQRFHWGKQISCFPLPWVESRSGQQQLPGQILLRAQLKRDCSGHLFSASTHMQIKYRPYSSSKFLMDSLVMNQAKNMLLRFVYCLCFPRDSHYLLFKVYHQ